MTYDITCTFTVKGIRNTEEAKEIGVNLCEHILDTFNDDNSIHPLTSVHVKRDRTKAGKE